MTTVRDPPPAAHGVGRRGPSGIGNRESRVGAARGRRSPPVARAR
ncbi:conserved hypothetical protein [Burkholderia pseudomallei Pasteur 52237]|nr:conserved hypothetical protein [Burkholderia pseudomallei Pasteur 52237]